MARCCGTLSPLQLYYETAVTTEALFVFVFMVLIWVMTHAAGAWPQASALLAIGTLCGVAALTRPVAKGLVYLVAALAWWWSPRPRIRAALLVPAAYLLVVAPWMYVNSQTYGFFGISRGEGLGLFLRAFDVDHLPPPAETAYRACAPLYDALRPREPALHYAVRDDLNFRRGYSALGADRAMAGFALEAIRAHPWTFLTSVAYDWGRLIVAPHRSVDIAAAPTDRNSVPNAIVPMPNGRFLSDSPTGRGRFDRASLPTSIGLRCTFRSCRRWRSWGSGGRCVATHSPAAPGRGAPRLPRLEHDATCRHLQHRGGSLPLARGRHHCPLRGCRGRRRPSRRPPSVDGSPH